MLREFNLLTHQPIKREVGHRTIKHRILASERGRDFYDGDRNCGYGGFKYDGRWKPIAERICQEYGLGETSSVLQIGCEKGFLLHDLLSLYPLMRIRGTEVSQYARNHGMQDIRLGIRLAPYTDIPFHFKDFDLVIAFGVVYTLNLTDAIKCLREIERVGKRAFITLATYATDEDYKLMRSWSLLGTLLLKRDEWIEVMTHSGYTGDYQFVDAKSLNLCES
jgi:hypothetical protein